MIMNGLYFGCKQKQIFEGSIKLPSPPSEEGSVVFISIFDKEWVLARYNEFIIFHHYTTLLFAL
jgi:hypothetical protein